jgi:AMMECR1 domain-containing protein
MSLLLPAERAKRTKWFSKLIQLSLAISIMLCMTASADAAFSKADSSALLDYAKACLLARIENSPPPSPPDFATRIQRPCFITFYSGRHVFACFGGFIPRKGTLAEEIVENIRLAVINDSRSRNISREKILNAGVQITFPNSQPEKVVSYSSINPAIEGMFIESAAAGVVFVPGEAKTASWAFREGLRRLGEKRPQSVTVYRFRAEAISTRTN